MVAGPNAVNYVKGLKKSANDFSETLFDQYRKREEEKFEEIMRLDGTENPYQLHRELGKVMTENVTVVRYNDRLKKTDEKLQELTDAGRRSSFLTSLVGKTSPLSLRAICGTCCNWLA